MSKNKFFAAIFALRIYRLSSKFLNLTPQLVCIMPFKGLQMKKNKFGFREFIILAVIILSAYTVWPSIQVHSKKGEAKQTFLKENPKLGSKSINFGLDLAGGTSITLQIDQSSLKDGDDIKDIQAQSLEIAYRNGRLDVVRTLDKKKMTLSISAAKPDPLFEIK